MTMRSGHHLNPLSVIFSLLTHVHFKFRPPFALDFFLAFLDLRRSFLIPICFLYEHK